MQMSMRIIYQPHPRMRIWMRILKQCGLSADADANTLYISSMLPITGRAVCEWRSPLHKSMLPITGHAVCEWRSPLHKSMLPITGHAVWDITSINGPCGVNKPRGVVTSKENLMAPHGMRGAAGEPHCFTLLGDGHVGRQQWAYFSRSLTDVGGVIVAI